MAPERLLQGSAAERPSVRRGERSEQRRNGSEGAPRAQHRSTYDCRQQAPSDKRGPEQAHRGWAARRPAEARPQGIAVIGRSCRTQALNEDPSACVEGCPSARQPVPVVAIGPQWDRAYGRREAGVAQPTGGRSAGRQAGGSSEGTRLYGMPRSAAVGRGWSVRGRFRC